MSTLYLSVIVLLPLAALGWRAHGWNAITNAQAISALELTLVASLVVALINALAGTAIAWTLVRDRFFGQGFVNALVDLPFALPTIVAGLTLLALYGPKSPAGVNVAFTRWAILLALLFVTLPFVVRTVQPVLLELDTEMEDAAASLGASRFETFRRVILPNILPAILSGVALAFARAIGEFGAVVLVSGNLPFKTEVVSVYVFGRIESGDPGGAAAASVVILGISFGVLLAIGGVRRWATRHDR
ncbi:MAG: sulfate ABC transporter permease subunit CysT [Gaiellaceae bacterium]